MSATRAPAPPATQLLQGYLDRLLQDVPGDRAGVPDGVTPAVPAPAPVADATAPPRPPAWRGQSFQALIFCCGRLPLAAPLVRLCGVIPWSGDVTALPGAPDWDLGLLHHQGTNLRVVDTAKLVAASRDIDAGGEPRHIVLFDEGRWGMACSGISEVLPLAAADVKWRSAPGRRPWLAGTVRERLCAVMDVDAFATMLAQKSAASGC